jgi:hypothetical protein
MALFGLKSDISENAIVKTKNWNERVFFREVNNEWKIELIHSSLISESK